jgi:DNA replication initiation complex subunit (GINS family)
VTEVYQKIIAAEPDHEEARTALGYQRHQGKWLTQDEINEAQGLVRHKGKWMTPEERDLDVVLEQLKETEKKYFAEVKKWIDQVASSSEEKRKEAKESLAKLEDKFKVKYLVSGLRSSSPHLRLFAAEELRRVKDELVKTGDASVLSAVKSLARMVIWDESLDVRSASMKALGAIDHPKTADAFIPFLGEESTAARIRTEDALSQFKSLKSVPPLIQLLERTATTLAFIEQYEKQIAQVIKDSIVLKSGQKIIAPANIKISPTLFDPASKRMLAEERDAVASALRAISGQSFGPDVAKWKAWYESAKK